MSERFHVDEFPYAEDIEDLFRRTGIANSIMNVVSDELATTTVYDLNRDAAKKDIIGQQVIMTSKVTEDRTIATNVETGERTVVKHVPVSESANEYVGSFRGLETIEANGNRALVYVIAVKDEEIVLEGEHLINQTMHERIVRAPVAGTRIEFRRPAMTEEMKRERSRYCIESLASIENDDYLYMLAELTFIIEKESRTTADVQRMGELSRDMVPHIEDSMYPSLPAALAEVVYLALKEDTDQYMEGDYVIEDPLEEEGNVGFIVEEVHEAHRVVGVDLIDDYTIGEGGEVYPTGFRQVAFQVHNGIGGYDYVPLLHIRQYGQVSEDARD